MRPQPSAWWRTRSCSRRRTLLVAAGFVMVAGLLLSLLPIGLSRPLLDRAIGGAIAERSWSTGAALRGAQLDTVEPLPAGLQLGISATPSSICATPAPDCSAGVTTARVSLTAVASPAPVAWPNVQVVFALDGTFFNGDFHLTDDGGYNTCDHSGLDIVCEESNGLPVFVAEAGAIATSIAAENPHSSVTFALADFESTLCDYGDCDGTVYRVDIGQFTPAADFGGQVASTLQANFLESSYWCNDCDFWDNFLHSPSITALYGILTGAGIEWSADAHHVVIVIGDTAPRDIAYAQNYCVSGWDGGLSGGSCFNVPCEPSYVLPNGVVPTCEGWIASRDGVPTDSIAALARDSPDCVNSLGGSCTIDDIDLWATPTDPYSEDWPSQFANIGGGPGGSQVFQNVERVLAAGCDMAAATGGSWDGPVWYTCANGRSGSLQYELHGSETEPNLNNPTLLAALRIASFGQAPTTPVAFGGDRPLFEFTPFGAIAPSPDLQATAACLRQDEPQPTCQANPTILRTNGVEVLGWNWSTVAAQNAMQAGDIWQAEFNVVATGPPYSLVPVDACTTPLCDTGGSRAVNGSFTSAAYALTSTGPLTVNSFPLAQVHVDAPATGPPPTAAPPPPPPPSFGFPITITTPTPIPQPVAIPALSVIGGLSLNAAAVGLLAAGFMRVGLRNKPMAMGVAMKSNLARSAFEH
ncbi:MAG: hypothetical protein L3K17_05320 [Thermoplasmata archaeon]|nr:hypothetical protein [Thermoplasmata archaeon]